MDYKWYQSDIDEVWFYELRCSFGKINQNIQRHTGHLLKIPVFAINHNMNHRWGEWHKGSRTIVLAGRLLKGYEWGAVEQVLKHEVAHQIVDEIFVIQGKPHGEAWIAACGVVGIDAERTTSHEFLRGFKGRDISPVVEKIRKLIIHGNDSAVTKEESASFLSKAQELMIRYNVEMQEVQGDSGKLFYIKRPVGPLVSSHKSWLGTASAFVAENYNVCCIWTTCGSKKRIEFYGDPGNLDIAEYVLHALLNQGEFLWDDFRKKHQEKIKNDDAYRCNFGIKYDGSMSRKISKTAFMRGLISGYRKKLQEEKKIVMDCVSPSDKAIIQVNGGILNQAFRKEYNPCKTGASFSRGSGFSEGHMAGQSLSLSKGVSAGGGGRFLTA